MNNKEFRVFKPGEFTVMPNIHLMDDTLSLKAIGLLSKMLNLPDNWDDSLKGLVAISKESYDTIRSILNELKEYNYIETIKSRNENGTFKYNYLIFMNPAQKAQIMRNYPDGKNPYVDEPDMESSDQYNINKYIDKKDKYDKANYKHNFLTEELINIIRGSFPNFIRNNLTCFRITFGSSLIAYFSTYKWIKMFSFG